VSLKASVEALSCKVFDCAQERDVGQAAKQKSKPLYNYKRGPLHKRSAEPVKWKALIRIMKECNWSAETVAEGRKGRFFLWVPCSPSFSFSKRSHSTWFTSLASFMTIESVF